ncbi:hypothetical protein ES703_67289 [subsurface metagenome]
MTFKKAVEILDDRINDRPIANEADFKRVLIMAREALRGLSALEQSVVFSWGSDRLI